MARFPAPWNWIEPVVDSKTGRATATFLAWLSQQLSANKLIEGAAPQDRLINTTAPLTGGGDLSADRTLGFNGGLDDLNDVNLTTPPTDGQALVFDVGTNEWKPETVAAGLAVKQSGVSVVNPATALDFTGAGVTVTDGGGGVATVDITGGSSPTSPFMGAFVRKNASQSIPNAVDTALTWETEIYDTSGFHSTVSNTSRLTIPVGVTRVRLSANVEFANNAAGLRVFILSKNGAYPIGISWFSINPTSGSNTRINGSSAILEVTPGDYFELIVHQTSGAALNVVNDVGTWFCIEAIPATYGGGGGSSAPWYFNPPLASSFPVAFGSVSPTASDDVDVGLVYNGGPPAGSNTSRVLAKAITNPTSDWEVTAHVSITSGNNSIHGGGIYLVDNISNRVIHFGRLQNQPFCASRWSLPTGFSANVFNYSNFGGNLQPLWLRIARVGTNHVYSASADGKNFTVLHTEGATTWLTNNATHVGVGSTTSSTAGSNVIVSVDYWKDNV